MSHEINLKRKLNYWWVPILFGIIFIAIGVWILSAPAESFEQIIKFIGVIILVAGTAEIFLSIYKRLAIPGWGYQLTGGLIDAGIGLILILNPSILLKITSIFVAIWLIISSVMVLRRAFEFRGDNRDIWRWELILGIVLLLLAILLLWHPMILGMTIAIWTAAAFIAMGVFRISMTIRLKRLSSRVE